MSRQSHLYFLKRSCLRVAHRSLVLGRDQSRVQFFLPLTFMLPADIYEMCDYWNCSLYFAEVDSLYGEQE